MVVRGEPKAAETTRDFDPENYDRPKLGGEAQASPPGFFRGFMTFLADKRESDG